MIDQILQRIEASKIPCYFISPHLDDAVFSAGSLISRLSQKTSVTVITVFTESSTPITLSARQFLKQSKVSDPKELFRLRKEEDQAACKLLGAAVAHLGFEDALFRKKNISLIGKCVPELNHIYPTYRYHIKSGIIAASDSKIPELLETKLSDHIDTSKPYMVFAPLATGKHVDHVLVRDLCAKNYASILYWNDIPYCVQHPKDGAFMVKHNLVTEDIPATAKKESAIQAYKSQWRIVFPEAKNMLIAEEYAMRKEAV